MADIVLKDRQGNPVTFEDIYALKVLLSDGTEQIMTPSKSNGEGCVVATGIISATTKNSFTIEHNLGVVPDLALIIHGSFYTVGMNGAEVGVIFGISNALKEKIGQNFNFFSNSTGANKPYCSTYDLTIDQIHPMTDFFASATETTINLNVNSNYPVKTGSRWLVIGGLT